MNYCCGDIVKVKGTDEIGIIQQLIIRGYKHYSYEIYFVDLGLSVIVEEKKLELIE